jgi:NADPH-dependent glutamate synthase beta subunit-like oxidoreductase/NAD(P)H-flavin reductase
MQLAHGFTFRDLYDDGALARLDGVFLATLPADLRAALAAARANPPEAKAASALVMELAPVLESFLATLFGVGTEAAALAKEHQKLTPLYSCKRLFVQRRAAKAYTPEQAAALTGDFPFTTELAFAETILRWLEDEAAHKQQLAKAERYAAWALYTPTGRAKHGSGVLFQVPHKTDPAQLVDFKRDAQGRIEGKELRARHGFALTDVGTDLVGALDEANYCITCHKQGKDSCSKGLRDKATGGFAKSAHGVTLAGCPLEEKISEFLEAKALGQPIAALAIICIDNPMAAATGHRICNDCMKSCIYQKQEPVDIPQAETRTLKDVLALPWGFEIYSLLTRWNPLNFARPYPKASTGKHVLIAGLGPAGYTLAHHLLNDGHSVFAIDGLKIEPLDEAEVSQPVRDVHSLYEPLESRIMAGFGGVAEYGITVRWDKNFLKLIRLLLERRVRFAYAGGVRLGGTLTLDSAFAAGFDHIALCMGAGRPTVIDMPGKLARGVRQASDFLMALQLTGAAKTDSLANLQLRLPVVVIGGGLTAIDTATEALAYYPLQVEKFLQRVEAVGLPDTLSAEEKLIADEFIAHAKVLRSAKSESERRALLDSWGGVTIAYRRGITDAPSYTLNHEEVALALQEGIRILDNATPAAVEVDDFGHAKTLQLSDGRKLPARAVLVAAGTQPNTVLARENVGIELDGKYFRAIDANGQPVKPERVSKPGSAQVLMQQHSSGKFVSFFGDLHPSFAGNVVKAMGSAKQGYPVITRILSVIPAQAGIHRDVRTSPAMDSRFRGNDGLLRKMREQLTARVVKVERLTPTIVEVIIHAPRAAQEFQPGQFYRLQNFERRAPIVNGTRLTMEGLAMTGAWVDKANGLVSVIALEMGGSSSLCQLLKPDEPVVLMGPTGMPTEIPRGENVLLIGGGLGNAVLFSIGAACRAAGNRVLYFAGYKKLQDRYKVAEIEAAADEIIWCCDEAPGFAPTRSQDSAYVGNMLQALLAHGEKLKNIDRIICIGSDRLMAAIAHARQSSLKPFLKEGHVAIGSINSPMQCMMKEICAQCLQRQIDPITGEETIVFSCFNQDQPLERVDFTCLAERLGQNSLQEKLTARWLTKCLAELVG